MTMTEDKKKSERRAFDISEFCHRYRIGRSSFYKEVKSGRLRAVRVGRRVIVTADDAEAWLASLPAA